MKMEIEIENHPLQPFLPVKARLLMLGSFPPQKSGGLWILLPKSK